jgi:hypothetical protein
MCSFIVVHERSITKCDLINNIIKTILPRSIGLFLFFYEFMALFTQSHFADLRFVSIYLWQNKRIGENDPSLMRHIYKRFFSKIEELRNYVKKIPYFL